MNTITKKRIDTIQQCLNDYNETVSKNDAIHMTDESIFKLVTNEPEYYLWVNTMKSAIGLIRKYKLSLR